MPWQRPKFHGISTLCRIHSPTSAPWRAARTRQEQPYEIEHDSKNLARAIGVDRRPGLSMPTSARRSNRSPRAMRSRSGPRSQADRSGRSARSDRAPVRARCGGARSTQPEEHADPIGDDAHSPVAGIVHRYPDRVLLKLVHVCPVYCRFCFRREMVGPADARRLRRANWTAALDYIRAHPKSGK